MATTRKATRKKTVKIVFWRKEVEKIDRPFRKKFDALFKAFDREKKKLGINTTADNNRLWNEKYQPKYNSIERQLDNRVNKLWLKYYTSLDSTNARPGYKIVD